MKMRSSILLVFVLSSLFSTACKEKNNGAFAGRVNMEIVSYTTGEFAKSEAKTDNVTLNLAPNGSHYLSYILSFSENSPVKCSLEVTDRDYEDEYVMSVQLSGGLDPTCEVKNEQGNWETMPIKSLTGRILTDEKSPASLNIDFKPQKSGAYKFSFDGVRK